MKKFRRFAWLALGLVAIPQVGSTLTNQITVPLVENRAYGTATLSACVTNGQGGQPLGPWLRGPGKVNTPDNSDTQVDGIDATLDVFDNVVAGDSIRFGRASLSRTEATTSNQYRSVASVTSADRIVVNSVIDLDTATAGAGVNTAGYSFEWRTRVCSTSVGWVPVRSWSSGSFLLIVSAFTGSPVSADYSFKCKVGGADKTAMVISTGSLTEAQITAGTAVAVPASFDNGTYGYDACELFVKPNVAGGATITYSAYVTYRED